MSADHLTWKIGWYQCSEKVTATLESCSVSLHFPVYWLERELDFHPSVVPTAALKMQSLQETYHTHV